MAYAPAGCAQLIQGNAADLAGKTYRAADLVIHPGHALLIGAHVRAKDILVDIGKGARHGPDEFLLAGLVHFRIAEQDRFTAAVPQAGRRVFHGHGPRQAETFAGADVRRHAQAADGRPHGHIVHHQDGPQGDGRLMDMDDFCRTQFICVGEYLFHNQCHR